ncbi:AMP-binding protein [Chitiniphilus shinanonensis]|uniref:AMP-binding protein n=1 Tax=Chitiniphilus shinanonensis TaxID=553088 RepID=UPI003025F024
MAEPLPLGALACQSGDWPLAWVDGRPVGAAQWRDDVARAAAALAHQPAPAVVLRQACGYRFAVWLFAAWHAGKTVLLPGDDGNALRAALGDAPDIGDTDWRAHAPATLAPLHDARAVVYTSGSTGTPVGVAKTLRQLDAEVALLARAFALPDDAGVVATVPPQHFYGLLFRVLWPLAARRPVVAATQPYPEALWALPGAGRFVLIASPAFLKRLPPHLDWPALAGRIAAVFSSGGPLPADAARDAAARLGVPVREVFGSTETGGIAWRADPDAPWTPLPGIEIAQDGELLRLRSPLLADDGWWTGSDRIARDGAGFRLLGRADRIVKLEEKRVSLTQVEQHLLAQPEIAAARVVALHGRRAELGAALVLSPAGLAALAAHGKAALARALRARLAPQLEPLAVPRRWRLVEALPDNAMGKTTEDALRALFAAAPAYPDLLGSVRHDAGVTLTCYIDAALRHFDGHFPGAPVLPGVALLDWVVHYARRHFALPPDCLGMQQIKFQHAVQPGATLTLRLEWQAGDGRLRFDYRGPGDIRHASGRLRFGEAAVTAAAGHAAPPARP